MHSHWRNEQLRRKRRGRNDTHHNDIHHNDIQYNDTQHKNTQHDDQCNAKCCLCLLSCFSNSFAVCHCAELPSCLPMVLGQQQQQIGATLYCRYVAQGAKALAPGTFPIDKNWKSRQCKCTLWCIHADTYHSRKLVCFWKCLKIFPLTKTL